MGSVDGGVVVDVHAHALPSDLLEALAREHPDLGPAVVRDEAGVHLRYPGGRALGPFPDGMVDLAPRLADMAGQGVDVQVLSVPPSHFHHDLEPARGAAVVSLHTDHLLRWAAAAPDRLRVLAGLPLQDPSAAVAEVARVAAHPLVAGVCVGTQVAGRDLDDPDLEAVWGAIAAHDLFVLVHPPIGADSDRLRRRNLANAIGNPTETTIAAAALLLGGVLDDHPALRVCLVHGGGFLPYQIGRLDRSWLVRPDPAREVPRPSDSIGRLWSDALLHDDLALRHLVARLGAAHVVLGSDYPFEMGDPDPVGRVLGALPEDQAAAVVAGGLALLGGRGAGLRPPGGGLRRTV
jgi:aminocarboxymuconate-semialdehyde decarboxylase